MNPNWYPTPPYYGPYNGPSYGPTHSPSYGPTYGPPYGPSYGPYYHYYYYEYYYVRRSKKSNSYSTVTRHNGSHDQNECDYCHRYQKAAGMNQCGATCAEKAKQACLLCKSRPMLNDTHYLCSGSCKQVAMESAPLLLEAPEGHVIYEKVEEKFRSGWKSSGTTIPTIKRVYKVVEGNSSLEQYKEYKEAHGSQEVYRYHGTSKECTLGNDDSASLCDISGCALCSILRTSFKVSLAKDTGAFGAGVYTSSASNKSYKYTKGGTGAMLLAKVVTGREYSVSDFGEVSSCPQGYDSVVFNRQNGSLNETVVYSDDAIRPVYLITF